MHRVQRRVYCVRTFTDKPVAAGRRAPPRPTQMAAPVGLIAEMCRLHALQKTYPERASKLAGQVGVLSERACAGRR